MKITMIIIPTLIPSRFHSSMSKSRVNKKEVYYFKEEYCNENETIVEIINKDLQQYFKPPILDVGSGIGDIAFKSFKGKKTILIDVNPITKHDYPCRPKHVRKQADFLEFKSKEQINTILISHTLQFIDEDIEELNGKIEELKPEYLVMVLNKNNDFMGEVIEWTNEHFAISNPEVRIDNFPLGYNLIKSVPFVAEIICEDFETLAQQISYLMLIDLKEKKQEILTFLKTNLQTPSFTFNQSIDVYHRL